LKNLSSLRRFFVFSNRFRRGGTTDGDEELSPTTLYIILASHNLVKSIDEFLSLSIGQTELLVNRLSEWIEKTNQSYSVPSFPRR